MRKETVIVLETALDHLTGEELGNALSVLNGAANVLDALFLPGIGKKNRPSGLLQVLCWPEHEADVTAEIFRQTHALGIRRAQTERYVLPREAAEASVCDSKVPAKVHELEGARYERPEADSLAALARGRHLGMPALRFHMRERK